MLLVDKPAALTSHDVVTRVRRFTGERRIGHAGTLDPFATGLLVLLLGRGTRLLPYIEGEPKVYDAEIAFGTETDTDDLTGESTRVAAPPERQAVARALPAFTGTIEQRPPAYSAKQVGGRRAYQAARHGEELALAPVRVVVHSWEPLGWDADVFRVRITCGGGTYIRALARDLGRATGSAAHLRSLRRLRSGHFQVGDALPVDPGPAPSQVASHVLPLRAAIPSLPAVRLDMEEARRIGHGMRVPARGDGERVAMLDTDDSLLAIADRVGDEWQPRLVLA